MNTSSVQHSYMQNQPNASWIDDPFDLKGMVKGVTIVSHKQALEDYSQELVSRFAKYDGEQYCLSVGMLDDDEQNELLRLYIESTDRETNECIYGDDFTINSDFNCALLNFLKDDTRETRENFAAVTRKNILIYYKESLDQLLGQACDEFLINHMNEQRNYSHIDSDNSDVVWGRF